MSCRGKPKLVGSVKEWLVGAIIIWVIIVFQDGFWWILAEWLVAMLLYSLMIR